MPRSIDTHTLERRIVDTFADVPRPPSSDIVGHACPECDELSKAFAPYESSEVPDEVVEGHYAALPLFSVRAHRYFLPAYLRAALRDPESDVFPYVVFQLSPAVELQLQDGWQERFSSFSPRERSAIYAFLEWAEIADKDGHLFSDLQRAKELWRPVA